MSQIDISRLVVFGDSHQVAGYTAQLHGHSAMQDTALIFIGTNDYLSLLSDLPKVANDLVSIESAGQDLASTGLLSDLPQNIQTLVAGAVPSIESAIHDLTTGEISNLLSDLPKVTDVVASINQAIDNLTTAGVQKIILFTIWGKRQRLRTAELPSWPTSWPWRTMRP